VSASPDWGRGLETEGSNRVAANATMHRLILDFATDPSMFRFDKHLSMPSIAQHARRMLHRSLSPSLSREAETVSPSSAKPLSVKVRSRPCCCASGAPESFLRRAIIIRTSYTAS
jgi:hypothetical protein